MKTDAQCLIELRKEFDEETVPTSLLTKSISEARLVKNHFAADFEQVLREVVQANILQAKEEALGKLSRIKRGNQLKQFLDSMEVGKFSGSNKRGAALRALISGQYVEGKGSNTTVEAFQGTYHKQMNTTHDLAESMGIPDEVLISDDFNLNVLKELYHISGKGEGFATTDKQAQAIAKAMATDYKSVREVFTMLGKPIGYVQNYAGWRRYDKTKVAANKALFVEMLGGDGIDQKTFLNMTPDQKKARIEEMYNHIIGGNNTDFTQHRSIHFANAEAEFKFLKNFGAFDNHYQSFLAQMQTASKIAGLMHMFGPSYNDVFQDLLSWAYPDPTEAERSLANLMYKDVNGYLSQGVDNTLSTISSAVRHINAIRHLGGAILTAFAPDQVSAAALASTVDGRGVIPTIAKTTNAYISAQPLKMQSAVRQQIGRMMLLNSYNVLATYSDGLQVGVNGKLSKYVTNMFKWTRLQSHSESVRSGLALTIGNILHDHAEQTFDQLPDKLKATFSRYSINKDNWDAMRKAVVEVDPENGLLVLSPEKLSQMKDLPMKLRVDSYVKYGAMINDYARTSTLESNAFSRQSLYFGQVSGTYVGEFFRHMAQFKQAGVNMMRLQSRLAGSMDKSAYLGVFGLYTLAGYFSITARDFLLKGKTNPWPDTDTEEGKKQMILLTMDSMNKGAGGLLLDMLFAEYHKNYRSLTGDIMGPTFSDAGKIFRFGASISRGEYEHSEREMIEFGRSMIPFPFNAPAIKPLVDSIIIDSAINVVNPTYQMGRERSSRERDKKRGQRPIADIF